MTRHFFATRHRSKALVVGTLSLVFAGCGADDGQEITSPDEPGSPPASVVIEPKSISLAIGEPGRVAVTVRDQDGDQLPSEVMWQSSAEGVATADYHAQPEGLVHLVRGVGVGTATLTATAGSAMDSVLVTVTR